MTSRSILIFPSIFPVALALMMLMSSCSRGQTAEPRHVAVKVMDNLQIKLEIANTHPYLAEYDRSIFFIFGDDVSGVGKKVEMIKDAGGMSRVNIYKTPQGNFGIYDGYFNFFYINDSGELIKKVEYKERDKNKEYYGCFELKDGKLVFLSKEHGAEAEPIFGYSD